MRSKQEAVCKVAYTVTSNKQTNKKVQISNIPIPLTVLADLSLLAGNLAYCYLQLRLLEEDHTGKLAKKKVDFGCNRKNKNKH